MNLLTTAREVKRWGANQIEVSRLTRISGVVFGLYPGSYPQTPVTAPVNFGGQPVRGRVEVVEEGEQVRTATVVQEIGESKFRYAVRVENASGEIPYVEAEQFRTFGSQETLTASYPPRHALAPLRLSEVMDVIKFAEVIYEQ